MMRSSLPALAALALLSVPGSAAVRVVPKANVPVTPSAYGAALNLVLDRALAHPALADPSVKVTANALLRHLAEAPSPHTKRLDLTTAEIAALQTTAKAVASPGAFTAPLAERIRREVKAPEWRGVAEKLQTLKSGLVPESRYPRPGMPYSLMAAANALQNRLGKLAGNVFGTGGALSAVFDNGPRVLSGKAAYTEAMVRQDEMVAAVEEGRAYVPRDPNRFRGMSNSDIAAELDAEAAMTVEGIRDGLIGPRDLIYSGDSRDFK